jgi:hypothetical protein
VTGIQVITPLVGNNGEERWTVSHGSKGSVVYSVTYRADGQGGTYFTVKSEGAVPPPPAPVDENRPYVGTWRATVGEQVLYHTSYANGTFERWHYDGTTRTVTATGIWFVRDGHFHIQLTEARFGAGEPMRPIQHNLEGADHRHHRKRLHRDGNRGPGSPNPMGADRR